MGSRAETCSRRRWGCSLLGLRRFNAHLKSGGIASICCLLGVIAGQIKLQPRDDAFPRGYLIGSAIDII
jgi:hypothetical protein